MNRPERCKFRRRTESGAAGRDARSGGSEGLPFLQRNAAVDDGLYLSDEDAQLGYGILRVRGNGQALGAPHHEVVLPADERTVKAKPPHATDEVPPLTKRPPAHGWP